MRAALVWSALAAAFFVPLAVAATSPLLEYRDVAYRAAGFAGVVALGLLLIQPLLAGNALPGLAAPTARRVHRWLGAALVAGVVVHVAGLWITSPPDVIDVLLFRSPTPFSVWGAVAMWAVFAAALLALFRRRLRIAPRRWRMSHMGLAAIVAVGTVVHAVLIEGTMGQVSKIALCALVLAATAWIVLRTFGFTSPAPGGRRLAGKASARAGRAAPSRSTSGRNSPDGNG